MNPGGILLSLVRWEGWITFGLGYYGIRIVADYLKKRLYWKTGQLRVHIHHFLLGFPLMVLVVVMYALNVDLLASVTAGFMFALFASETRELITQEWEP